MKQTQVLKAFIKSWKGKLSAAQVELSSTGSAESRVKVEVLQSVVNENDKFFENFQVVKRPPRKGRKSSKVLVDEDETTVTVSNGVNANR